MKKIGLLFVAIATSIMISGCGEIIDDSTKNDSTKDDTTTSKDTTTISRIDTAKYILRDKIYYVNQTDNSYTKNKFSDDTLIETRYRDGEVIETNIFSISYSGTTIIVEGDTYQVTKETHSVSIVSNSKTMIFWDTLDYAQGTDAESILTDKTFYSITNGDDGSSYYAEVFSKDTLTETSYTEDGEVIKINTMSLYYSSYSITTVEISNTSYNVTRQKHSVTIVGNSKTFIMWDTLDYARENYDN